MSRSHPHHNLLFLLSGGGKLNYAGTKRWLEEHLDMDTTSDILANVDFVLCLDSLGKSPLKLHVSKPPKVLMLKVFFSLSFVISDQSYYPIG